MTKTLFGLSLMMGVIAGGCGAHDDHEGDDAAATHATVESAGFGLEGVDRITTADPVAAAAEAASTDDRDDGCRTRRLDDVLANVVHITLRDCKKRFGRHAISGDVTLTFSSGDAGTLHVERTTSGLTVDGRPASHQASTDIVFDGDRRVATTRGTWQRTRDDGSEVTRDGQHVVSFDTTSRCRVAEGTSTDLVDGVTIGTGSSHLAWCELADGTDECPVGEVLRDRAARGKRVVTRFDGTAVATSQVTGRHGTHTRTWPLACTPSP